ncbi:ABC transporter ATP-binding protein [Austwickia chelonae]|nr:ABC transporter ATP-binding protein [Austwickia chelonae]
MSQDRLSGRSLLPGTARRVFSYALIFRRRIVVFLVTVVVASALVAVPPLLLRAVVDRGVLQGDERLVILLSVAVALVALVEAGLTVAQRWQSALIGEGLIFRLRTEVFNHVCAQPLAFFTRTRTGALVSRLNSDVIGAQQAFTSTLSAVVSNVVTLMVIVGTMAVLSWPLTLASLALFPLFLLPARRMGGRLSALTRESMNLNADMATRMTERFDVAGALLVKLFGRPSQESGEYAARAAAVRDIGVRIAVNRSVFMASLTFVAAVATAVVYGSGGLLAARGHLTVGTLLALTALLARLYTPLIALSNVRVDVLTALVSFERVFEVLDLVPAVQESADPVVLPAGAPELVFEKVCFRYPSAGEVSLPSLEGGEDADRRGTGPVLEGIDFRMAPGSLVALVGPSGAGKTTITSLVSRLYDPTSGTVRLNGVDLREVSTASLRDVVGVVTQDAHLFHDTIRSNLTYARPGATSQDLERVLRSAQIWDLVEQLPAGLDTVVGDRGHRLSGGEKQRLAIARLLLKEPGLLVLDEATAHLDSGSEAATQRALEAALVGRSALVIAHRLSTVRHADLILVVDGGRVVQRGTHEELLAEGGLYAHLHEIQFSG